MKTLNTLEDLFWDQIKDIYNAENQLVKALPKVAKKSSYEDLENAILEHLQETKTHVQRLEQVFQSFGKTPRGQTCEAMEGLVKETKETLEHDGEPALLDAAIICSAQKAEHYEIATYGTLISWARLLGYMDTADLLELTLQEEKNADRKLTEISENIISHASLESDEESEDSEESDDVAGEEDEALEDAEVEEMEEVRAASTDKQANPTSRKQQNNQPQSSRDGQDSRVANPPSRNDNKGKLPTLRDSQYSQTGNFPARNQPNKHQAAPRNERNRKSKAK